MGLAMRKEPAAETQHWIKLGLGAFTLYAGFHLIWSGLGGGALSMFKQIGIVMIALILGNLIGQTLRVQKSLNRLGSYAKERLSNAAQNPSSKFNDGLLVSSMLFCVTPLALLGPISDGLNADYKILLVKSVMDGLAALSFVAFFGWSVLLSAMPVLALQGSFSLAAKLGEPYLSQHGVVDSITVTTGFLTFTVVLIVFGVQQVKLGDYLPSLIVAPFLAALWW